MRVASRSRGTVLASAFVLAGAVLSSCGSASNSSLSGKSGTAILAAATQAAKDASSVHVVVKNAQGRLALSLDLNLTSSGGSGRLSYFTRKYEVVRIGDTVYIKGTKGLYESLGRLLKRPVHVPDGSWLKGPASVGPLAQLAAFVDMRAELSRLLSAPRETVTKGTSATVNGQKAIQLKQKTKVYEGSLYVATDGKPYPIEQVRRGEREHGRTTYTEWNEVTPPTAPSQVVELPTVTG